MWTKSSMRCCATACCGWHNQGKYELDHFVQCNEYCRHWISTMFHITTLLMCMLIHDAIKWLKRHSGNWTVGLWTIRRTNLRRLIVVMFNTIPPDSPTPVTVVCCNVTLFALCSTMGYELWNVYTYLPIPCTHARSHFHNQCYFYHLLQHTPHKVRPWDWTHFWL